MIAEDILARLSALYLDRVDDALRTEVKALLEPFASTVGERDALPAREFIGMGMWPEAVATMGLTLRARMSGCWSR